MEINENMTQLEIKEMIEIKDVVHKYLRRVSDTCKNLDMPNVVLLLNTAADMIEKLSAKVEELYGNDRWIPVEERLPEDGQRILATHLGGLNPEKQVIDHVFRDGKFVFNWYVDEDFSSPTFGKRYMGEIIAWQPFPKAYEPKEKQK